MQSHNWQGQVRATRSDSLCDSDGDVSDSDCCAGTGFATPADGFSGRRGSLTEGIWLSRLAGNVSRGSTSYLAQSGAQSGA
jgi:hypothetical protein